MLKPNGKNLVSTVGKSPTTPKPGDRFFVQANLDADSDVAIVGDGLRRAVRIREAEINQLARFVQNPMLSQRHESQHAGLGLLIDNFSKTEEIDRSRGTRIHRRGYAGG
jgi:hypothetical protein